MSFFAAFVSSLPSVAAILAAMALVALIETAIPLHARARAHREHLGPNLALTMLSLGMNLFINAGLLVGLAWAQARGFGLLPWLGLPAAVSGAIAVAALDLTFYASHVAMHKVPWIWRFHAVHHSDPALDVTTTIRQHPVEGLVRYGAMAAATLLLIPSPAAFAVYRLWNALGGLLEHANLSAPLWLDRALAWVTTWPYMHKLHHSRIQAQTDSNYGNLFSFWDRAFGTYTPSSLGTNVRYGLDGCDDPAQQTTAALLVGPFGRPAVAEERRGAQSARWYLAWIQRR
jgi:sterol desaturase/sphingolipid hydroxylase (fatty acid hydroxylase superfamily)